MLKEKHEKNKNLANCNVSGSIKEACPGTEFGDWVDSVGGPKRVAKILGVNESTLWRQMQKDQPDQIYINMMKLSKKNASLIQENCLLKKRLERGH